jgi:hypothetical protein
MPHPGERRSGKDRRQQELGAPDGMEKRKKVEDRKPEIFEIMLSEKEWKELFGSYAFRTHPIELPPGQEMPNAWRRTRN